MEQPALVCPQCSLTISPGDTILFGPDRLSHPSIVNSLGS